MPETFTGQKPNFTALPNWLRGKATAYELAILWILQSYWPEIRPSVPRIATETGLSRRQVIYLLGGMERKGWLIKKKRFLDQGGQATNLYELTIWSGEPGSQGKSGKSLLETAVSQIEGGASDAPTPVQLMHSPSAPDALPPCTPCTPPVQIMHPPRAPGAPEEEQHQQKQHEEEQHEEEKPLEARVNARRSAPVALRSIKFGNQEQDEIQADPESETQPKTPKPARGPRKARKAASEPSDESLPLPPCAEPFRALVVAWWKLRCKAHKDAPRVGLSSRTVEALLFAEERGVLRQFCEIASTKKWESLGFKGYRQFIEELAADEAIDGFSTILNGRAGHPRSRTVSSGQPYFRSTSRQSEAVDRAIAAFAAEECSSPINFSSCSVDSSKLFPMPNL